MFFVSSFGIICVSDVQSTIFFTFENINKERNLKLVMVWGLTYYNFIWYNIGRRWVGGRNERIFFGHGKP